MDGWNDRLTDGRTDSCYTCIIKHILFVSDLFCELDTLDTNIVEGPTYSPLAGRRKVGV